MSCPEHCSHGAQQNEAVVDGQAPELGDAEGAPPLDLYDHPGAVPGPHGSRSVASESFL